MPKYIAESDSTPRVVHKFDARDLSEAQNVASRFMRNSGVERFTVYEQ